MPVSEAIHRLEQDGFVVTPHLTESLSAAHVDAGRQPVIDGLAGC